MTKPANTTSEVARDAQPQLIEIFRVGAHTDMSGRTRNFSQADLRQIAESYDPELHEAPVVVGHPKTDDPAFGWVRRLVADGDSLFAEEHQVDDDFNDMRRKGRFKKRSVSLFLPDSPGNPTPGKLYARHVGWLGAAAPAVKGLKNASFADDDVGVVEFAELAEFSDSNRWWVLSYIADLFRGQRERMIEAEGIEKADRFIPAYQINSIRDAAQEQSRSMSAYTAPTGAEEIHTDAREPAGTPPAAGAPAAGTAASAKPSNGEPKMSENNTADFAAREQKIADDAAALEQREKALADRETKARRDDAADFADGLVKDGKLLPKDKAPVVELLLALPTAAPLSFASGDDTIEKPAAELFRELLDGLPQRLDFSEKSRATDADAHAGAADFAAPPGTSVDPSQLELHRKAKAYQAQHPNVTFLAAVQAVGG